MTTTAGFFDDDAFRNSEAMRALQEAARVSLAPAIQALRQANAVNVAKIMEAARPIMAAATAEATKSISKMVLPAIEMPKVDFNLGNLSQIKLGDDVARQIASSIDYMGVARSVATEIEETAPEEIVEAPPEAFTEQKLDTLTIEFFESRPEVAAKFYNDTRITTLNPSQKKMLAWQWALVALFGIALLYAWAKVDGNVGYVMELAGSASIAGTGYVGLVKTLEADEDDIEGQAMGA